jgi:hypothetical protein
MRGGVPGVDQEIAVHLRDLCTTDAKPAAARGVDQFPGAVAGWILEGRAAGLFPDRLRGFAVGLHLVHPRPDRFRCGDHPAKACRCENDLGIDAAVAIDEFHIGIGEAMFGAVAADADSLEQHIPGLAAVGAGIHAQRAADTAGNAEEKLEPADIGRCRRLRDALVERRGAGVDDIAVGAGLAEPTRRQSDHDAGHAAIAHDQIGADADYSDRQLMRQSFQKISQIVFIRWREQHLRGTADPKPGQLGERLVGQQPPAQFRHRGFEIRRDVREGLHFIPAPSVRPAARRPIA